jgi:lipoprotein-anchoring transpeptidase ErfK/SrfK
VALPSQDEGSAIEMPARLRRQVVSYATREVPGTIIIDTPNTYLYYVLGGGERFATASASAVMASPGPAPNRSPGRPNGRIGRLPRK